MATLKNKTQRLISLRYFVSSKTTKTIKLVPTKETEVSASDLKELKNNDGVKALFEDGSIEEVKKYTEKKVSKEEASTDTDKKEAPAKKAGRPKKTDEIPVSED